MVPMTKTVETTGDIAEVPVASGKIRICWEGAIISEGKRLMDFDGVPYVVLGSEKHLCCSKHAGNGTNGVQISRKSKCAANILVLEVAKYTDFAISGEENGMLERLEETGKNLRQLLNENCTVLFERRFYVFLPSQKSHVPSGSEDSFEKKTVVACNRCSLHFVSQNALVFHLQAVHKEHLELNCEVCDKKFKTVHGLMCHQREVHRQHSGQQLPVSGSRGCTLKCHLCDIPCYSHNMKDLANHYREEHSCSTGAGSVEFADGKLFEDWKKHVECRDGVSFVKDCGAKSKNARGRYKDVCYVCSWQHPVPAKRGRGEQEINSRCPAFLFLRETAEGRISVEHCLQHIGHATKTEESNGMVSHRFCPLCGDDLWSDALWHVAVNHPAFYLHDNGETVRCLLCQEESLSNRRLLIRHLSRTHGLSSTRCALCGREHCLDSVRLVCKHSGKEDNESVCPVFLNFYYEPNRAKVAAEFCMEHLSHSVFGAGTEASMSEPDDWSNPESASKALLADIRDHFARTAEERKFQTALKWISSSVSTDAGRNVSVAEFSCQSCSVVFRRESELKNHRQKVHSFVKCRVCSLSFRSTNEMMAHTNSEHASVKSSYAVNLTCTICGKKIDMIEDLACHYRDDHGISDSQVDSMRFQSAAEFYRWKADMETRNWSYFAKRRRTSNEWEVSIFFNCCFSWGDRRRALSQKKTERHCPAFMKASIDRSTNIVLVSFCSFHFGHEISEEKFWKQVQKALHGILSFQHKARFDRQRATDVSVQYLASRNVTEEGGEYAKIVMSLTGDSVTPQSVRTKDSSELDQQIPLYWDLIKEKLKKSGFYSLSVDDRWSTNGASAADLGQGENFCRICQVPFKTKTSMLRHMHRIHDPRRRSHPTNKYSKPTRCLFCNMEMAPPAMKSLIQHYINAHDQPIQLKNRTFQSESEFAEWRDAVSSGLFKRYKLYKAKKGDERQYWTCKFSGHLRNPPQGVTEGYCPAWIFCRNFPGGSVDVSYCLYHIGHDIPQGNRAAPIQNGVNEALEEWNSIAQKSAIEPSQSCLVPGGDILGMTEVMDLTEEEVLTLMTLEGSADGAPPGTYQLVEELTESAGIISEGEIPVDRSVDVQSSMDDSSQALDQDFKIADTTRINVDSTVDVLVHSVDGTDRLVQVQLDDFPVVMNNGQNYFSVDENNLIDAVRQIFSAQNEILNPGDSLELIDQTAVF